MVDDGMVLMTKISKQSAEGKGYFVYSADIDELLYENGFAPAGEDWTLVGYRRTESAAKRLAKKRRQSRKPILIT
ncbi:MAG TPA: hypothetical protein VLA72_06465 [Anaerolineales bacterium]|nr:hypothetical protein [Anaerolineales bacterium]